ncbi:MAG TPA: ABC transporter permease [bacterium]|nr:ABC transporter permease [bacterium]
MATETAVVAPAPQFPPATALPDPFAGLEASTSRAPETFLQLVWKRFRKNKAAVASMWVLLALFLICFPGAVLFVAPEQAVIPNHDGYPVKPSVIAPFDTDDAAFNERIRDYLEKRPLPFALGLASHPFGTDSLGRDYLSRCLYGGRISLTVGFVAVAIAVSIGTLLGASAGFFGGITDSAISRFTEIMLSFPTFFLIITIQAVLSPNIYNVMAVIGFTSWMGVSRLVRGQVLAQKEEEYIQASRASGAGIPRILLRHLIPNSVGPIVVAATLAIPGAILTESALSYFGMGVQPPMPSWGNMVSDAREWVITRGAERWWLITYPGLLIAITVIAFNFLGEGLRDALDPRA